MFANTYVFIYTPHVGRVRCEILEKRVRENGGEVVVGDAKTRISSRVTHFVSAVSREVCRKNGVKLEKIRGVILSPDWITESLRTGQLRPTVAFVLSPEEVKMIYCPKTTHEPIQTAVASSRYVPKIHEVVTSNSQSLNAHLIKPLEELAVRAQACGEAWRANAYRKACSILKSCNTEIRTVEEAAELPGVGESIANKIGEILDTGRLKAVETTDPHTAALMLFTKIWGVGTETAEAWYAQGHRTLKDVEIYVKTLTPQQRIGLKYYEEFNQRIPRKEVKNVGDIVSHAALRVNKKAISSIVGSYCRGAESCGDIDILLTLSDGGNVQLFLKELVRDLTEHELLLTDELGHWNNGRYLGVCQYTKSLPHRRIDIVVAPHNEWEYARFHWSCSALFSRTLREWVKTHRGWRLSEHGLTYRDSMLPIKGSNRVTCDEDIFNLLDLVPVPLAEREFAFRP